VRDIIADTEVEDVGGNDNFYHQIDDSTVNKEGCCRMSILKPKLKNVDLRIPGEITHPFKRRTPWNRNDE
jgi:hypothetical protein